MDTETLIGRYTEIRKEKCITQRKLADMSRIPQPAIARLESTSPRGVRIDTLNALLLCMGYTLDIVPITETANSYAAFFEKGKAILDKKMVQKNLKTVESSKSLKSDALKIFDAAGR